MADDNAMNLRNRAVPRNSGNEQHSSSENIIEQRAVLPAEGETSSPQEPSLAQALGQMTRVLQALDQNSHASTARLDAVLAALTASNEGIARIGQFLNRNEQPTAGLQMPVVAPAMQNPATPVGGVPQYHGTPLQAVYRPAVVNAGQQPDVAWGLPPPPPIAAYQPQNVGAGGQAHNGPGLNPMLPNIGNLRRPNDNLAQIQVPIQGINNEIHAQIEEIVRNTFGVGMRPAMRPVFRSPYPLNIDTEHPYPANWKMPKFDKFAGDETENTVEHVARFTAQCREAAVDPFLKLRLFNTSLTKTAFTWYTSLPANSVRDWDELEGKFHEQFYRTEPELSVADLAQYRQRTGESVDEYLNRFKTARNRCFVRMPESEFAKMAFNGMHFKIKDHFEDKFFPNLFDLGIRVAQYEQFRKGSIDDRPKWSRNKDWKKGKEKNISSLVEESSTYEEPNDLEETEDSADETEICAAEMVRNNQPYKCALLKPAKSSEAKAHVSAFNYSFDISKTDLIFDRLLKDGRIKLQEGQTLPSVDEIKRRKYCKWHHSWSHRTSECTAFKRQVQKEINEGRLIFADQENKNMEIDKNPFPPQVNVIYMKGKAAVKRRIQEEIEEGRLIVADQQDRSKEVNKNMISLQDKVMDARGKAIAVRTAADDIAHAKRNLRFCIRCKTEMTKKDWESIINDKKKSNEWNDLMAFPENWENIPEGEDLEEDDGSDGASNETEPEINSVQQKQDILMQKILHDYYNNQKDEHQSRWNYQGRAFGSRQRFPGYRPHWQHQERPRPEPEFEGMTEGDIEFLGRRLVNELGIQPWPRPWERREILRNHLRKIRTVKVPANVPVDEWHQVEVKPSARWHGPMLTKTQKRRQQRMQAEANQNYEEAKGLRFNVWRRPNELSHPFRPAKNDHEAGGSTPAPWLKSKVERPTEAEPEDKMSRKELEEKIASLETIIKRERWPPKEREARIESDSSAETAKESEEKKQRIKGKSVDDSSAEVNMVYALPQSFKAELVEYEEYSEEEEIGLKVAQLQLEDVRAADAVTFEKPSAMQTRFIRPLFIKALIEGRPVGRVMVDGGAMVNVMPTSFFKKLGKDEEELKPTDSIMTDFTGNGQPARGVLTTEITVGSKTVRTAFFVVDADSHYNLLLGRDWIHANECVPSTLHGKLFQWVGDKVEEVRAEGRPQMIDINMEDVGHINWADADPDQISFVKVTEEGVQLVFSEDMGIMVATEEPPGWLKWNVKIQE